MKLRVPLCYQMYYKGFLAVVIANPPVRSQWINLEGGRGLEDQDGQSEINEKFEGLVHGHTNIGSYHHHPQAQTLLKKLGRHMNIKVCPFTTQNPQPKIRSTSSNGT